MVFDTVEYTLADELFQRRGGTQTVAEHHEDEDYANPAPPTPTSPYSPLPFKRLPLQLPKGKHREECQFDELPHTFQNVCLDSIFALCKFVTAYSDSFWADTNGTPTVVISDDEEDSA